MTTLNLSLTVTPNAKAQAILDAFCIAYGYDPASGVTQVEFVRSEIKEFLRQPYVALSRANLDKASRQTIAADLDAITIA